MEILAKKIIEDEQIKTQTLQEHTSWVTEEALKLIDDKSLSKISMISGWEEEKILDLIFFSCYFHDIGKATIEFQNTINNGTNSYHSLYSVSVLNQINEFNISGEEDSTINLLLTLCLTHHTLLPYNSNNAYFTFLDSVERVFLIIKTLIKII